MVVIGDEIRIEVGSVDMSSSDGPASVTVRRALVGADQLANAVGWIEPGGDEPTQLQVCEQCGHNQCEPGGYAQLTRMADGRVLVSPPRLDRIDGLDRVWIASEYGASPVVRQNGSAVFTAEGWEAVGLPPAASLPPTTLGDIRLAWLADARLPADESADETVVGELERRFITSDPALPEAALDSVAAILARLSRGVNESATAALVDLGAGAPGLFALFLERPPATVWYATVDGSPVPVFAGRFAIEVG